MMKSVLTQTNPNTCLRLDYNMMKNNKVQRYPDRDAKNVVHEIPSDANHQWSLKSRATCKASFRCVLRTSLPVTFFNGT